MVQDGDGGLADLVDDLAQPPEQTHRSVDVDVAPARAKRARTWLAGLEVAPRRGAGYDRELFGDWTDADGDGLDTREEILERDLERGALRPGPYTGRRVVFDSEDPASIHIDHVRALGDAWEGGADEWSSAQRRAYANDFTNLLAVDGGTNMSKSDDSPAEWRPDNRGAWCLYSVIYVETSHRYQLTITRADQTALAELLGACPRRTESRG
jgi:hypothetical protein